MKTYYYIIEDDSMGIPLEIEGEIVDFQDDEPPDVVIQGISHNGKELSMWTLSSAYIGSMENKLFQHWCLEGVKS